MIAEVTNQYAGIAPDDARLEPVWALAEELEIPVGIHMGGGASRPLRTPAALHFARRVPRSIGFSVASWRRGTRIG